MSLVATRTEQLVVLLHLVEQLVDGDDLHDVLVGDHLLHGVAPGLVHRVEAAALLGHLRHDVGRAEDRLQVKPARGTEKCIIE